MAVSIASAALVASTTPLAFAVHSPVSIEASQQVEGEAIAPTQQQDSADTNAPDQAKGDESAPPADDVIVVTAASEGRLKDPLVNVNEASFQLTQEVDAALVEPIAGVYEDDLPSPVRKGLRNFFRNLMEPISALNFLLQLKPGKAFETLGRFAINTTAGVGGLFDVAKREPFNLPYRRNGFANTLGYYGVGPGPFLVVPLVGATSLRDLLGTGVDQSILPFALGKPFNTPVYAVPAFTVNSLEYRIQFDERLREISESDDPYFATRESYLCLREADIAALKNRPPPRDCSIEALLGLTENAAISDAANTEADDDSATQEVEMQPEVEPAAPEIIYVSEEVVQVLPEG